MQKLSFKKISNVLVNNKNNDDAGIYKLNENIALVHTVDFITPVVNDPFIFGQIAAANSMSDVFAMGGKVLTVLNLVAFDNCNLTKKILREILKGGRDKVEEAGGFIVGGHSIEHVEMLYGLAVTGSVHPKKYIRNNTPKHGNKIILTKPIGLGIIATAIKADQAPKSAIQKAQFFMSYLNKKASELAIKFKANAMTDVTGFGLIGSINEMTDNNHSIILDTDKVPIIEEARELAPSGLFPGGSYKNKKYFSKNVEFQNNNITDDKMMLLYDAQTSGGLLISVNKESSQELLHELKLSGMDWCEIIGEVTDKKGGKVILG